jgi:D-alanine-D-alanine ligase
MRNPVESSSGSIYTDDSICMGKESSVPDRPTSVLVLMGGPDAEREVSLRSGAEVADALQQSGRFRVTARAIDRPTIFELKAIASACEAEVVFPILHGRWGEGGPLQELLEQLGMAYVGSQPRAAALAMDKLRTKALVSAEGVPTPPSQEVAAGAPCHIAPPLVLKPIDDGSSVDLRVCRTQQQVQAARTHLHPRRGRLMAEAYIRGRELTVGIVLDQPLPLIEIIPAVEFYDYEAKYSREDTRYMIDPAMPPGVAEQCVHMAMTAYRTLGCRDIARADIMLNEHGPWFLEINTMPGFTTHSLVPMAARRRGWEMPELCARLAQAALQRGSVCVASRGQPPARAARSGT